jgi:predicted AAA+ superfamily ATPase
MKLCKIRNIYGVLEILNGASWEGFLLQQVIRRLQAFPKVCYFWATHGGTELDLFVLRGHRRYGFEFKRTTSPRVTPSMRSALSDLKLDCVFGASMKVELFPGICSNPAIDFYDLTA